MNNEVEDFVGSRKLQFFVIPAEAGIQAFQAFLDPGFRRGDGVGKSIPLKSMTLMSNKGFRTAEVFLGC